MNHIVFLIMNLRSLFYAITVMVVLVISGCKEKNAPDVDVTKGSFAKSVLNLTPDFIGMKGVEVNKEYEKGALLSLTLTAGNNLPDGFYDYHMEHIHVDVNGKVYFPVFTAEAGSAQAELTLDIEVPETDFDVVVCYSAQQQFSENGYTMSLENTENVKLYGVSHEKKYKYFDAYLLATDAYVINNVQFKVADGEWQNVNEVTGCSFALADNGVEGLYSIVIRPDYEDVKGNVLLRVEGEQHGRYAIKWDNLDVLYVDTARSELPADALNGEVVSAELVVKPDYYLKSIQPSVDSVELTVNGAAIGFVMPSEDLTLQLEFAEKLSLNCEFDDKVEKAEFYDADDMYYGVPVSKVAPGEHVFLFVSAAEGFKPTTAKLATGQEFSFVYYMPGVYRADIAMPADASDATVQVLTQVAYTVEQNENVYISAGHLYTEGEKVDLSVFVPEGQQIKSLTVTDVNGNNVSLELDLPYASFVMPASNVKIEVVYEALGGETVSVIGQFDADIYDISSSTNYDWDFQQGFTVEKGSTFYVTVYNYEYTMYYVGVKIGDEVTIYPAEFDDMMGEYSFGKSLVANGDIVIKVGATEEEVTF